MTDFFTRPILNSPFEYAARHWELDENGESTNQVIENRRRAEFLTPIPKPKKRKGKATQKEFVFRDEAISGEASSTAPRPSSTRCASRATAGAASPPSCSTKRPAISMGRRLPQLTIRVRGHCRIPSSAIAERLGAKRDPVAAARRSEGAEAHDA